MSKGNFGDATTVAGGGIATPFGFLMVTDLFSVVALSRFFVEMLQNLSPSSYSLPAYFGVQFMRFIKIVLLLVITYWTLSHIFSNSSDTDHKRAVAAQQASALAEKTKLTATLKTDREHIVREIGNLIALGEYGDVL